MRKCEICGLEIDNPKVYSNHVRWQHLMKDRNSEAFKNYSRKVSQKKTIPLITKICSCKKCGKNFEQSARPSEWEKGNVRSFCSLKCANSRVWSEEDKKYRSEIAKANPVGFCAPGYSAKETSVRNHSKAELEIVRFFKENFKDDEWKAGLIDGSRRHNGILLNPDLWSKKLKVVIEYDGIWHFEDIHGQLEHKQSVDREVYKFCKENNFRLIRIDEDCKISMQEIVDSVYHSDKDIEIFNSKRYDYLFK